MLGKRPQENEHRDAVHVAIMPAVAGCTPLHPGQRVQFSDDGECVPSEGDPIGYVDPELAEPLKRGDRFWLCMFSGTVTGTRHHWQHPRIADDIDLPRSVQRSIEWLAKFAAAHKIEYDDFMRYMQEIDDGEYPVVDSTIRDAWYEHHADILLHYGVVTGRALDFDEIGGFSCSC